MEIRFEKACTGEYSVIHAEAVIKTEESHLEEGLIRAVGVIQNKEDAESFYMYETTIDFKEFEEDEVEFSRCELNAKMEFYFDIGEEIFPWVSKHFGSVMIPDGTLGEIELGEELPFLANMLEDDKEITLYKQISEDVNYPDL